MFLFITIFTQTGYANTPGGPSMLKNASPEKFGGSRR
jgi:hypothetical protein